MFATLPRMTTDPGQLRWRLTDAPDAQGTLFDEREWIPGTGDLAGLEMLHVRARRVVNRVPPASRMPFRWTINVYRGCSHACVYCFARPTHEYLGLGIGEDFERRIVVKVNAPERVRAELSSPRWTGEHIAMGTNTDPYQVAEGRYRLTRGVIEVLAEARNPFSVLTKSPLITRDTELLAEAAGRTDVQTALSVPTLDRAMWRATEPRAPSPHKRLEAVARLNAAGVPCGVLVAPVLPGLTDDPAMLRAVVRGAVDAGATSVSGILLHLRPGVREHYLAWLRGHDPRLAERVSERYRGPYLPRREQERFRALLADLVSEAAGRPGGPAAHRMSTGKRDSRAA